MALSEDFKDDILATVNPQRKFRMINNPDGTVSFEDVTEYQQVGTDFGALQVNTIAHEVNSAQTLANTAQSTANSAQTLANSIISKTLKTLNEVKTATQKGFYVDALAVKELNSKVDNKSYWVTNSPRVSSIPSGATPTQIYAGTFDPGFYVLSTSIEYKESFENTVLLVLSVGENYIIARGMATGGGGLNLARVVKLTSSTLIQVTAQQGSSSSRLIKTFEFSAVKL